MKISKQRLEEIIKEEIEAISEVGMYHDPKTGRWTKQAKGAVKSLSKQGAEDAGVSSDHVGRGVVTAKGKIQAKFGMNHGKDECGRKSIQTTGDNDISPRFSCSDYKQRYDEGILDLDSKVSISDVIRAADSVENDLDEQSGRDCSAQRSKWLRGLLLTLNNIALSSKGELMKKNEAQNKESETKKRKISNDAKQRAKRKKLKSQTGLYFPKSGFSKTDRELLNTNSLWESLCGTQETIKHR